MLNLSTFLQIFVVYFLFLNVSFLPCGRKPWLLHQCAHRATLLSALHFDTSHIFPYIPLFLRKIKFQWNMCERRMCVSLCWYSLHSFQSTYTRWQCQLWQTFVSWQARLLAALRPVFNSFSLHLTSVRNKLLYKNRPTELCKARLSAAPSDKNKQMWASTDRFMVWLFRSQRGSDWRKDHLTALLDFKQW